MIICVYSFRIFYFFVLNIIKIMTILKILSYSETKNIDNLNAFNEKKSDNKIYLITQFFIHSNIKRHNEIVTCLIKNLQLVELTNIILLNEKIYSEEELGISDLCDENKQKIMQICINKRLTYKDVLLFIKERNKENLNGYYIFANSDIFFDNSLKNLPITSLSREKSFYAILRFEYDEIYKENIGMSKLLGPAKTSQDTWIIHSNFCPNDNDINKCDFSFGLPGCDNVIAYLFNSFGYKIYNEPYIIKTYHYHSSQIRNYSEKNRLPRPYLFIYPVFRSVDTVRIIHEAI